MTVTITVIIGMGIIVKTRINERNNYSSKH